MLLWSWYCETAFIKIIRQIRVLRFTEKSTVREIYGAKESIELFKNIPSENLRIAKLHFTNVRSAELNEFAVLKMSEKEIERIYVILRIS